MIIEKLTEDMKAAMKSGDKLRLATIRMLMSELKNAKIAKGDDLTEADRPILSEMLMVGREMAGRYGVAKSGYKCCGHCYTGRNPF